MVSSHLGVQAGGPAALPLPMPAVGVSQTGPRQTPDLMSQSLTFLSAGQGSPGATLRKVAYGQPGVSPVTGSTQWERRHGAKILNVNQT